MEIKSIAIVTIPLGTRVPEKKYDRLFGNRRLRLADKYGKLIGNYRKGKASRQDVLLTVRDDAVAIRAEILKGDRRAALRDTDWLIDNIDNKLAEGC